MFITLTTFVQSLHLLYALHSDTHSINDSKTVNVRSFEAFESLLPAGTVLHWVKGCHYFSSQNITSLWLVPNHTAWWQEAHGWTIANARGPRTCNYDILAVTLPVTIDFVIESQTHTHYYIT